MGAIDWTRSMNHSSTILVLFVTIFLTSCENFKNNSNQYSPMSIPALVAIQSQGQPPNLEAKQRKTNNTYETSPSNQSLDLFYPPPAVTASSVTNPRHQVAPIAGDLSVEFNQVDLRQALKVIIGDLLKQNFVLHPSVQGKVTLKTIRPLTRSQMITMLEAVLAAHGLTSIFDSGILRIIPAAEKINDVAMGDGKLDQPGYGIDVIPLHHISSGQMAKLLLPIFSKGQVTRLGGLDNLVLLSGSLSQRRSARQAVKLLDVDRMANQSVAIIELKKASLQAMIEELNELFSGGTNALTQIKFTPIKRLNALMITAPTQQQIIKATTWIKRLDLTRDADRRRLFVYFVQHGEAPKLVKTLRGAFGGNESIPETLGRQAENDVKQSSAQETTFKQSGLRFSADKPSNSILVWATRTEYDLILEVLIKLDITPLQVLIEGTILEVSLKNSLRYGLKYFIETGEFNALFTSADSTTTVTAIAPGFGATIGGVRNTRVVIDALSELTDVRVVSSPQLLVVDGETARLHVGDQIPIVKRTSSTTVTNDDRIVNEIEYRDTGVTLNVTPKVKSSGLVTLAISQEVSDVVRTNSSDINSPTIQQRRITSTAAVPNGTTVLLAGLIRDIETETNSGVPGLHQIPFFGPLFGIKDRLNQRTELIVLITPRVVQNEGEAEKITRKLMKQYQQLIQTMDNSLDLSP